MNRIVTGLVAATALVMVAPSANAQRAKPAQNSIYLELGGSGVIYSMNYERMVSKIGVRAGFSYLSVTGAGSGGSAKVSATGIPLTMSYLGIGHNNKLELGGGLLMEKFSGQASWGPGQDVKAGDLLERGKPAFCCIREQTNDQ